jgi:hypothetical protein
MNRADELAAEYLIRQVPEEPLQPAHEATAERLARLHEGFYAEHDSKESLPSFVSREPITDGPDRVSPLEAVAGFAVLGLVFVLIFWGFA